MSTRLTHQGLPFDGPEDLVDAVAPVAEQALRQGRPVLAVFPDPLGERIRDRLGTRADNLAVLPYDTGYDAAPRALARFVGTVRDYAGDGVRPTLMGGSMLVTRTAADMLAWMQMEAVLNDALADADAHLLCCYPRGGPDPWLGAAAESTHPSLLVDGTTVPSLGYLSAPAFLAAFPEPPGPPLGEPVTTLAFGLADLHAVRLLVGRHATQAGLAADRVGDLVLAVHEAAANTVEHGPGAGTLRVWAGDGEVTCEVHDRGQLDSPYLGLLPPVPTAPRGRGLWLIRQLPDRTRLWTDESGTTVRMTVRA
jgi:anti-sigma regulatory factor (Ser/Thr protein kinase)